MSREPQPSRSMFRSYAPADVRMIANVHDSLPDTREGLSGDLPRTFLMSSDD